MVTLKKYVHRKLPFPQKNTLNNRDLENIKTLTLAMQPCDFPYVILWQKEIKKRIRKMLFETTSLTLIDTETYLAVKANTHYGHNAHCTLLGIV